MLILRTDKPVRIQHHYSPRRFFSVNALVDADEFMVNTKSVQIAAFDELADALALQDKIYEASAQDEDFDVNEFCHSKGLNIIDLRGIDYVD